MSAMNSADIVSYRSHYITVA